ncbi:MAG: ATP-binding protein [Pseudohongiellaceae bacterium]|nr:ATP-binding protein [Pseudohongiellaceae bacterium]
MTSAPIKTLDYSLQNRLLIAVSCLLFVFLGLTGVVLDRAFRSSVEAGVAEQLQVQIYVLLAAVEENDGEFYFLQDLRDPRFSQLNSGLYGFVSSPVEGEKLRTRSALEVDFESISSNWQDQVTGETFFSRYTDESGREYFVASYAVVWEDSEVQYSFTVLESTNTYMAEVANFRTSLWSWLGGVALLLLILQVVLLRWGLSPLRRLAGDLKRIESGESEQLVEDYPRELRAVTDNLNLLIKTERKQQARYRETLGDLAHSLKTPLAVVSGQMRALTELNSSAEAREQIDLAQEQLGRMNQIIGYQLQRAVKSNGSSALARRVSIVKTVEKIVGALNKVYGEKGMLAECRIDPDLQFYGDERDLMEVMGNLLDNAYKYGHARVLISSQLREGPQAQLSIFIEDDGPGVSGDNRERVLQRGTRLDTLAQGQGIGLAVVADIVKSYGGQIDISTSSLGGAKVQLVLNNFRR